MKNSKLSEKIRIKPETWNHPSLFKKGHLIKHMSCHILRNKFQEVKLSNFFFLKYAKN